ncbi:MAG: hypothetical protein KC618_02570 [Candidatus Omnitrophica bacterium]|nr:hypothetical protein [Candidatus Omnitrophota bacterium]
MRSILLAFLFYFTLSSIGFADEEASNRTYVKSSEYGQFYVKSVPAESYGLAGKTRVYWVKDEQDQLLFTYDWYSPELYIYGFAPGSPVYVVKFGPWHRGHLANHNDLAIAFYKNDQLLKEYSTLDIVKDDKNVSTSVSHYTMFKKRMGFRRPWGNQIIFDVQTLDDKILSFNTETGELISQEEEALGKRFYDIQTKISQIKWQWYEKNKETIENVNDYDITEADLKKIDPDNYPIPPEGYKIMPNKMWKPSEIIKL